MGTTIPDNVLSTFSRFVESNMGLSFPKEKWSDLERGIRSAASEFSAGDAESCVKWLMSARLSKGQVETLASHLTVGETYFFRDRKCFDILEKHIIPGLVRSRAGNEQNIRLWSAGCATGEEPYSLAILIRRIISDLKNWNITILATDINPRFLQKAREGVYTDWSFRESPNWVKEHYFTKTAKGFELRRDIRNMVTFSYHNIIEDPFPSLSNNTNAMDIIFCRNVLMYFSQERARDAVQHFYRCLAGDGRLIVSAVETSQTLFSAFRPINYPGVILYRKTEPGEDAPSITIPRKQVHLPQPQASELGVGMAGRLSPVPPPTYTTIEPAPAVLDSYEEALQSYRQGRYAETVEKITSLLSSDKASGHNKGCVSRGDEGALHAKAMALLARTYANQGRLSDALLWCERAIASDKMSSEFHYLLATILQEVGQAEEAVAALKRTLYLDQDFVPAHFLLGNLTRQQGKFEESGKHFENALSILKASNQEDVLPESEGMTAGRLCEIIRTMLETESRR
ncbi:MAG: CheR family methyltransferase [Thermodesulfovibrionales bacterium]